MTAALIVLTLLGQTASLPADSPVKAQAQSLLSEGTALYARGDYAAALAKFEAAYTIYPSPKLQFNIAQADRALGRPVEAIEAFERFLALAPDAAPELLAEAYQTVADLRAKLGRIKIQCQTEGAELAVDGRVVGMTPFAQPIWVFPGRHKVEIRHAGYSPTIVKAAPGEVQTIVFELPRPIMTAPEAVVGSPSNALPVVSERVTPGDQHQEWWSRQRWYVWAAAGGTVAFSIGAIVAGLAADSRYSELQNSCGHSCSASQVDSLRTRADLANTFWILAGASAAATGVGIYVDNHHAGELALSWRF